LSRNPIIKGTLALRYIFVKSAKLLIVFWRIIVNKTVYFFPSDPFEQAVDLLSNLEIESLFNIFLPFEQNNVYQVKIPFYLQSHPTP